MTAYMIVQSIIYDDEQFARYRRAVVPLIQRFGGKHVRGGAVELLEGQQDERRIALFEFPSMENIHQLEFAGLCPREGAAARRETAQGR
jgi:uncharacterized protein (DUF1330 family)